MRGRGSGIFIIVVVAISLAIEIVWTFVLVRRAILDLLAILYAAIIEPT